MMSARPHRGAWRRDAGGAQSCGRLGEVQAAGRARCGEDIRLRDIEAISSDRDHTNRHAGNNIADSRDGLLWHGDRSREVTRVNGR